MKVFYKIMVCALVLLGCGAAAYDAYAVPAYPGPVTVTQPDGTKLTIRIYGDEWANYITTDDGYAVKQGEDGFFYHLESNGKLSSVKAKAASVRTAADKSLLKNMAMGVPSGQLEAQRYALKAQFSTDYTPEPVKEARMTHMKSGEKFKSLVILVDFPNKQFITNDPQTAFTNLLNQDGYSSNGATGSAWNYYDDNSNGKFDPQFDVFGTYRAPNNYNTYAAGTWNLINMFMDILRQAVTDHNINLDDYSDGNQLRHVFFFYAGHNNAEAGIGIHPHMQPGISINIHGKTLTAFACTSELSGSSSSTTMCGIGTFCHEYGHVIDLPDFYDTDYGDNGTALTPKAYSLMDYGSYNNNGRTPPSLTGIERFLLGWATPVELTESGSYSLPHVSTDNIFMIRMDNSTGDRGEYFILETRTTDASINKWDSKMGGTRNGMIVMQIDRTASYINRWNSNSLNDFSSHPCARPVRAKTSSEQLWVFPGGGNVVSLDKTSHSYFAGWQGNQKHSLTNISYSNGVVSFNLEVEGAINPDPVKFSGTVRTASNQNVSGGTVKLTLQKTATGANSTTKLVADGSPVTTSISSGSFNFPDVRSEGTYIAEITGTGYQNHTSVVTVSKNGTANFVVDSPIQSSYTRKSWASSYSTSAKYTSNGDMIIGAKFDYADFGVSGKVIVYGADYHLSSTAGVELQVYDGNNNKLHSVPVSNFIVGNSKYVDLTSLDLSLSSGESIVIAYKLANYSGRYPATMSGSTSNRDKGALIKSTEGGAWSTGDANWMIGIYADEQKASGVVFDMTAIPTFVGNVEHIGYSFVPEGTTSTLTWKSSDNSVLSVDPTTGEIKCYGAGTATVTATLPNNASATCQVTVAPEIDGKLNIEVNNSDKKAVVSWTPAIERDNWVLQWRPKNGSYTKINTKQTSVTLENLVWGTEYEVTVNGLRDDGRIWGETTGTFKSEKPSATGVTLTKTKLDVFVGDMQALEYKMIPEDGIASLNWTSSDTSVLTVDGEGVIKPFKAGKATVTVSSKDFTGTATCEVTISSEIDGDINIEVDNLAKGASVAWKAAATRSKWNYRLVIDGKQTKAAQVTKTEIEFTDLPAGAQGELFVSGVRSDGEVWGETRATFQITDKPAAEKITLDPVEASIFVNEELQLTATVTPENAFNSELEWSSSAPDIVSVDQNGLIKGEANGEAIITVKTKVGNISATCAVTVTTEVAPVKAVTVYQNDAEFEWPGSQHEGAFQVKVFAGNSLVSEQTVEDAYAYVQHLSPNTAYEIVVTAVREGGNSSTLEFTTEARGGKFASMRGIKGSYSADELVPLRITNIQGDVASIEWKVDNAAVTPPSVKLGTGRHEIKATVTRKDGHKEIITKFVNIQ